MTSLWFIVFIFGQAGMIVGPLPYDMDECQSRLTKASVEIDQNFSKSEPIVVDGKTVERQDITMKCILTSKHPEMGDSEDSLGDDK